MLLFCFLPLLEIYLMVLVYGFAGGCALACRARTYCRGRCKPDTPTGFPPRARKCKPDTPIEGIALLVACALLVTPGYVTDAFGFILLAPNLRLRFIDLIFNHVWGEEVFDMLLHAHRRPS